MAAGTLYWTTLDPPREMVFCSRGSQSVPIWQNTFPWRAWVFESPKIHTHINVNTRRHTFTELCRETLAFCEQQGFLNTTTSVNAPTHCNHWHKVSQLSVRLTSRDTAPLISSLAQTCVNVYMRTKAETIQHAHKWDISLHNLSLCVCVNDNNDVQDSKNEIRLKKNLL